MLLLWHSLYFDLAMTSWTNGYGVRSVIDACIAFALLHAVRQVCGNSSSKESAYYTAGVVEFRPVVSGMTSADMVREHLNAYMEILYSAEANTTDIIVFPEGTLNNALQLTYVPAPEADVVPCLQSVTTDEASQYADFLVQLSCAARDVRKYVLINLTEKERCPATTNDFRPCANTGLNIYNTNVVFDREGRVVSRYRKVHVYLEEKNTTMQPEFAIFETDFGVRFGHFICFDMLFYTPAKELVRSYGVHDLIFPSWFYSELPFLTAVQLQQSWAWANDVNLLAAGASYPQVGTTGSGIYAGTQGALTAIMAVGTGMRQLLVAQVPKKFTKNMNKKMLEKHTLIAKSAVQELPLMKDPQLTQFNSELIDFALELSVSRRLCYNDHCCQFDVLSKPTQQRSESAVHYQYRLGVFEGERTYEEEEWSNLKICALYVCLNESVTSCGEVYTGANIPVVSKFVFQSVRIESAFANAERLLIMPNSLTASLYPLTAEAVKWQVNTSGDYHQVHYSLNTEVDDLLTFAIYANYYDKSAATMTQSYFILLMLVFLPTGLLRLQAF